MNVIAMIDTDRGRFDEAERFYNRILEIQREKLGPDTPLVLVTLNIAREQTHAAERLLFHALIVEFRTFLVLLPTLQPLPFP